MTELEQEFPPEQYNGTTAVVDRNQRLTLYRPVNRKGQRKGLLKRDDMSAGVGLLLDEPIVHMQGMKFALDLVFVTRQGYVKKVCHDVQPGFKFKGTLRACKTIELKAGQAKHLGIAKGSTVAWDEYLK